MGNGRQKNNTSSYPLNIINFGEKYLFFIFFLCFFYFFCSPSLFDGWRHFFLLSSGFSFVFVGLYVLFFSVYLFFFLVCLILWCICALVRFIFSCSSCSLVKDKMFNEWSSSSSSVLVQQPQSSSCLPHCNKMALAVPLTQTQLTHVVSTFKFPFIKPSQFL